MFIKTRKHKFLVFTLLLISMMSLRQMPLLADENKQLNSNLDDVVSYEPYLDMVKNWDAETLENIKDQIKFDKNNTSVFNMVAHIGTPEQPYLSADALLATLNLMMSLKRQLHVLTETNSEQRVQILQQHLLKDLPQGQYFILTTNIANINPDIPRQCFNPTKITKPYMIGMVSKDNVKIINFNFELTSYQSYHNYQNRIDFNQSNSSTFYLTPTASLDNLSFDDLQAAIGNAYNCYIY